MRCIIRRFGLLIVFAATAALAQYAPPPQTYSLTNVNSGETQHIYRDGSKALIEITVPAGPNQPAVHTRSLIDIPAHKAITWDVLNPSIPCGRSSSSDWGDPFLYYEQVMQTAGGTPKPAGEATVNGMKTRAFEVSSPDGNGEFWRDEKYGLVVRFVATPKGGQPMTMFDIKDFSTAKPATVLFVLPARCK